MCGQLQLFKIWRTLARHDAVPPHVLPALPASARISYKLMKKRSHLPLGQRLASAFEQLGPVFIKFGQMLSTRPDIVGEDISDGLIYLQDKLPAFDVDDAIYTIEDELNRPLKSCFKTFDTKPVAAASIAQVHKATLPTGQMVAVKILRPGIEDEFARTIKLLRIVAKKLSKNHRINARLNPVALIDWFENMCTVEMNLNLEAAAANRLAQNFKTDANIYITNVYWDYTAKRVLTTDWIDAVRIDDVTALKKQKVKTPDLLKNCAQIFFNQVFRDGFFHADMHPGNMMVLSDGRMAPIDFGIMGQLDQNTRYYLADMLAAFLQRDYQRVADIHMEQNLIAPDSDVNLFAQHCRVLGERMLAKSAKDTKVGPLLGRIFELADQFGMRVRPELLLLQKTIMMAEGIGRTLDPKHNMWHLIAPDIKKWMRKHRGPEARLREKLEKLSEIIDLLPDALKAIASQNS